MMTHKTLIKPSAPSLQVEGSGLMCKPLAAADCLRYTAKNLEVGARNKTERCPATKSNVLVRGVKRIGRQGQLIVVRSRRLWRNIFCQNRVIRRKWEGDDLIQAHTCPRERMVHTVYDARGVAVGRPVTHASFLHRRAKFAQPHNLPSVAHTPSQLFLRPGATGRKCGGNGK